MTNYEKYFGSPEKTANTLEEIIFNKKSICRDFCSMFTECGKNLEILDDYDFCDGIKYFLKMIIEENKNAR